MDTPLIDVSAVPVADLMAAEGPLAACVQRLLDDVNEAGQPSGFSSVLSAFTSFAGS